MRSLIESLTPEAGRIEWMRIGAMFALYAAAMAFAASLLMAHHPVKGELMQSSIASVVCKSCTLAID